ncbi:DUF7536 family protein [Halobacterium yunchengense]|uniref:DUF7536 family protein n=1 Tax=Halobacterium yunchengense TaxID=3108497 RepID=UPI0030083D7F
MSESSGRPADGAADASSDRSGVDALVAALDVPRQARRGFLVGLLAAAGTYYFFVVASGGSPYSTPYLVALALVLAFTTGLLATLVLTVVAAYRLSRDLE